MCWEEIRTSEILKFSILIQPERTLIFDGGDCATKKLCSGSKKEVHVPGRVNHVSRTVSSAAASGWKVSVSRTSSVARTTRKCLLAAARVQTKKLLEVVISHENIGDSGGEPTLCGCNLGASYDGPEIVLRRDQDRAGLELILTGAGLGRG